MRMILAAALALAPAAADASWQQASSRHFVVYSDDAPDKVKAFTARLERYDKAMHLLRNIPDQSVSPSSRVTVYVVKDTAQVQKLAGKRVGNVAGFYIPRAEGSVAFIPRRSGDGSQTELTSQAILLHEYAHHFMFSTWGNSAFPGWFVEGFAEFNATARFKDDGSITFGAPPLYRAYGMTNTSLVPARRLLTANPNTLPDEDRQVFYGRAWLLTHYLAFDPERSGQLSNYIAAINNGKSPADAAAIFGDGKALDRNLDHYAARSTLSALTLPAQELGIGEVVVRPLSPAQQSIMPAVIQSQGGVDAKTAPGVAALARAAAAPFPNDEAAQNELAEAEFDAKNYAASDAAAARALATDATSIHALLYRGMAQMAVARQAANTDPATWRAIRLWFVKANHLDRDDPWPLVLNYQSLDVADARAIANAETGLLYAHLLAPFDPGLSLMAAMIYLRRGKLDDARTTLKPVAYNPHGGGMAAVANKALDMLGTAGAKGALTVLEGRSTVDSDDAE